MNQIKSIENLFSKRCRNIILNTELFTHFNSERKSFVAHNSVCVIATEQAPNHAAVGGRFDPPPV
jgi:hypothetical protein